MRIERLEIAGFKSFAEPVTLEFGQGATAVVGPNGCGKSNIADAVFWVLGELGAGTIRARGKELIFSGSALREPLGVAEVRLHVSGVRRPGQGGPHAAVATNGSGNGGAPPPGASGNGAGEHVPRTTLEAGDLRQEVLGREVVVGRRVDASGQSIYEMDGRRCTRRDIRRLFAGTGLGPGSYALIEQGRANDVLSRRPADLRLLVEEAVGLGAYRMNRRESEANLRAAETALDRVRERLAELDRAIRVARRDSRTATRVREASDRLHRLRVAEQVARREELLSRLGETVAPEGVLSAERERRFVSFSAFERFVDMLREEVAGTQAELREAAREIGGLEARRARASAVLEEGARAAETRTTRIARLEAEAATVEARFGDLEAEREESARRAGAFPGRLAELTEAANARATTRDGVLAEERDVHAALWELRREVDRLRTNVRSLEMSREQHAGRRDRLAAAGLELAGSRRELEARLDHETRELAKAASRAETGEREATRLLGQLEEAEARWNSAVGAAGAARDELAGAERDQAEVAARLRSLEALVVSRDQLGESVSKVAEAARRRGLTLGGAVGELVEVDGGYEAAAERVLGVHRIRIDRVSEVSELVEELGGDAAGPSEVVVSELVRVCDSPGRPQDGGDRLRDHLKPVDPGMDAVIPDAVVTADLEAALAGFLAAPGLYVSRDGASVAPPGVVRFGRGGPGDGFLRTRREVAELEIEVREGTRRLDRLSRSRAEAQETADQAGKEVEELRGIQGCAANEAVRLRLEASRHRETAKDVRKRIEELEAETARHAEEVEGAARDDAHTEKQLARDEARLGRAAHALSEREAAYLGLKRDLEDRERRWREADRELTRQNAIAEEVVGRARDLDRQMQENRKRLERIRVESAAARREEEEWVERSGSARRARRSADTAIAEWEGRERRLAEASERLGNRLEGGVEALRVRGLELRDLEERLHQVRAGSREVQGLLRELENEFRRAHARTLDEAARSLPAALWRRPREEIAEEVREVQERIKKLGPVNEIAETRLRELEAERSEPESHLRDVEEGIADGLAAIRRQDREARRIFRQGFEAVSAGFDEAFRQLFGGGRAELRLVEIRDKTKEEKPGDGAPAGDQGDAASRNGGAQTVEEASGESAGNIDTVEAVNGNGASLAPDLPADAQFGVEIAAQPPGKKLQSVRLLSGGEKAMTAIAFLIALFRYRPAPFCLLDEVDAPLDDANVQRFASMLGELKRDTQLVVITHNRLTMEGCEHLYGVTMEEPGVSRLISMEMGAEVEQWIAGAADSETADGAAAMPA